MIKPDHPIFMKKDIPKAELDPIKDSDGKDDFTEGKTYHDTLKKATIEQYEIASDSDNNFLKRVGHFLLGTSNAGRWGKVIKDFALFFVPYGKQIGNITDFVTDQIEPNQNDMAQETIFQKITRFLKQESTRKGLAFVAGLAGTWFSIDIDVDLLLQSIIGIASAGSLLYAAWKNIKDIFTDEDE